MKRWPTVVAMTMLLVTWGSLQVLSYSEPVLSRKSFAEFPLYLADRWSGRELGLDPTVLDVLKLSDYMMRIYVPTAKTDKDSKSENMPLWLYVGYYQSQRTGTTYHSPKNCLPGAGWQFVESEQISVPVRGEPPITINKVLIQKGLDKQVILYWYHDRGRIIASEYWAKGFMVWDAVTKHRTDGALVRLSVPVVSTPDAAYHHALDFLQDLWPLLPEYLP
ncbi:MAG TPA: EpsI family protein [Nitrospiraceae bacterium]|nr:EpsI family protein [Nitrospiraceae bacterium]